MGTTSLAVIANPVIFLTVMLFILVLRGKNAMRQHWAQNIGIGLIGLVLFWSLLFSYALIITIYDDHINLKQNVANSIQDKVNEIAQLRQQLTALQLKLDDRDKRRQIRVALGRFVLRGANLLAQVPNNSDEDMVEHVNAWELDIRSFMIDRMDESYYALLLSRSDLGPIPDFSVNPQLSTELWVIIQNLQKFIKEYEVDR